MIVGASEVEGLEFRFHEVIEHSRSEADACRLGKPLCQFAGEKTRFSENRSVDFLRILGNGFRNTVFPNG
jgi:hypothetical protein